MVNANIRLCATVCVLYNEFQTSVATKTTKARKLERALVMEGNPIHIMDHTILCSHTITTSVVGLACII